MRLRPYQCEAVDRTAKTLAEGRRAVIIAAPTGLGKTAIALELIRMCLEGGGRALFLVHRIELVRQFVEKANDEGFYVGVEQARNRAGTAKLVCATVHSLARRLSDWGRQWFNLVVIDEAHHAYTKTYRRIVDYFQAPVVGLTATPYRRLKKENLGAVFEDYSYFYPLPQAIDDGWLVPCLGKMVCVEEIDLRSVKAHAGDFDPAALERVMQEEKVLHGIARPFLELYEGRRTMMFVPSIAVAERMAEVLNRYSPGCAKAIHSRLDQDEIEYLWLAHRRGEFPVLVCCGMGTEGYDDPGIRCIALCRPTKSRLLYVQMIGRGLRPIARAIEGLESAEERRRAIAQSEKPDVLLLDFYGQLGRHSVACLPELVHTTDRVVNEIATAIIKRAQEPINVSEAVSEAVFLSKLLDPVLRSSIQANVRYRQKAVHPLVLMRGRSTDVVSEIEQARLNPIGPHLARALKRFGVNPLGLSNQEGEELLRWLIERRRAGLMTYKQARILVPRGFPLNLTKEEATKIISDLESHRWLWTKYSRRYRRKGQ